MGWALSEGDAETAARLGWALWMFWWFHGHHSEGRRWMETLLELDLPPNLRPRVIQVANIMAYIQGDQEAVERYSPEALELSRHVGDTLCAAYAWCGLGLAAMDRGDFERATACFEEALPLFSRSGEDGMVPVARVWLGTVARIQNDYDWAVPLFEEALVQARQRGDRLGTYSALYNLAQVALARGDYDSATRMLEEGVALSEQLGDRANLAHFLEGLAVVAGSRGEAERSARLFGAAEGLLEVVGASVYNYYQPDRSLHERTTSAARSRLGQRAFEEAWAEGKAMYFDEVAEYALGIGTSPQPSAAPKGTSYPAGLSVRELEILGLVAQGLTNAQVAERLYLSPRTVGQHLRSIYRKLGVPSRAAAAKEAVERSLI